MLWIDTNYSGEKIVWNDCIGNTTPIAQEHEGMSV